MQPILFLKPQNNMIIRLLAIISIFLLTGCGFMGLHMAAPPCWGVQEKRDIDHWTHPERSIEEQMRQWIACGGGRYGNSEIFPLPFGIKISEEYDSYIHRPKRHQQQTKCMLYMGYHSTSICSRDSLTCHETRLDKYPILGTFRE